MASINQLISEVSHSLSQPNNYALRESIRNIIIHTRNESIRRSYENHGYTDRILNQRFKVSLTTVNDGDTSLPVDIDPLLIPKIKRTTQIVPRPTRLPNNLPFNRVSTIGSVGNNVIPFIQESRARFRASVPGLSGLVCYDYINEYIYLFPNGNSLVDNINFIIIESAFELPSAVKEINDTDKNETTYFFEADDDEYFIPEDMIGAIKDSIYKRNLLQNVQDTNEPDRL